MSMTVTSGQQSFEVYYDEASGTYSADMDGDGNISPDETFSSEAELLQMLSGLGGFSINGVPTDTSEISLDGDVLSVNGTSVSIDANGGVPVLPESNEAYNAASVDDAIDEVVRHLRGHLQVVILAVGQRKPALDRILFRHHNR